MKLGRWRWARRDALAHELDELLANVVGYLGLKLVAVNLGQHFREHPLSRVNPKAIAHHIGWSRCRLIRNGN